MYIQIIINFVRRNNKNESSRICRDCIPIRTVWHWITRIINFRLSFYLPHQAVKTASAKLRVVFDGSAKFSTYNDF